MGPETQGSSRNVVLVPDISTRYHDNADVSACHSAHRFCLTFVNDLLCSSFVFPIPATSDHHFRYSRMAAICWQVSDHCTVATLPDISPRSHVTCSSQSGSATGGAGLQGAFQSSGASHVLALRIVSVRSYNIPLLATWPFLVWEVVHGPFT
jgi:hypothetical protein